MVHEIYPEKFDPAYSDKKAELTNYSLAYQNDFLLVKSENGIIRLPSFADIETVFPSEVPALLEQAYYLFAIDENPYFLISLPTSIQERLPIYESLPEKTDMADESAKQPASMLYFLNIYQFRQLNPLSMVFAGATGSHIARWKESRTFCGRCASKMVPSAKERAFICPSCGQVEYPKISPAVIVAIKNNDKLLLVRNNYGPYRKPALVAGFVEVGESFEEAIHREVMEEVGLKVKNIKYYKSQPWAFSDTEMIGFTADLDGDDTITLQESELSDGGWYTRDEIPEVSYRLSVGTEMIHLFKTNRLP